MPYSFDSARIMARPVTGTEAPDIEAVFEGNGDLLFLLDREHDPAALAAAFVEGRSLPPRGRRSDLFNLTLRESLSGDVIGLAGLYVGYPKAGVAYLGEFFLARQFQGVGLGREAYLALESRIRAAGLEQVRVGVGLRNWNGLRFWIRLGFDRVSGMSGDRRYGAGRFAFLELQKFL